MKQILLVSVIIVALVAALVVQGGKKARNQSCSSDCKGSLSNIISLLHSYRKKYGHFPPAVVRDESGRAMHSWRVLLLEFSNPDLYAAYRFDEPWDSPANLALIPRIPNSYICPADRENGQAGFGALPPISWLTAGGVREGV